jgi:ABC-type branched-subunit amino acid transport system ATPase component
VAGAASASGVIERDPRAVTAAFGHDHARVADLGRDGGLGRSARALACEDIHIRLGGRPILEGVSLGVAPGEVLGVVGPNGAGKTTLFEVLSGRYAPERGRVFLGGRDVTALRLHARARLGLGRTYQSPVVPDALTVGEVLRAARQAFRPYLTRLQAEWAAEIVGLRASPATPSGSLGALDRRKLLLACLLLRRPSVMLLDEPAAGLINAEIDELDAIIRHIAGEMKIGVMLVEHRLELLSAIADRVVVLDLGRLIAEGPPEAAFDDPRVRAAYFEVAPS